MSTRILVTGATGNLGTKAVAALRTAGLDDLVLFGREPDGGRNVLTADLGRYDDAWADRFEGVDVVVHLAADPVPTSGWDSILHDNVDLSLHVLRAAETRGVGRLVFAASNWILGGYRFTDVALTPTTPPLPISPYGAAKLFIERAGFDLSARTGMTFLSMRIGYCQPGTNTPGTHMAYGRWGQEMWLSNEDWGHAVVRACTAPCGGAVAFNVMSANEGMRWSLEEAREAIGYVPGSRHRPVMSASCRARDAAARVRERIVPSGAAAPLFGARW